MGARSKHIFNLLYKSAEKPEDLPWYDPEPPIMLVRALDQRATPGRALDLGCGAGTYSMYLAQRGYEVTAIDFMPQAVELFQKRLEGIDLPIEVIQADVGQWSGDHTFDVVLDIGCLHSPGSIDLDVYKSQLLKWLSPGGDLILLHFGKRGWWDCWPLGPNRVYADTLCRKFGPEIELVQDFSEVRSDLPLFIGKSALSGRYWFRRR